MSQADPHPSHRLRLDVWLDVACLFRTRSEAQKACRGGKVDVNQQRAKPHREIGIGDEIAITRPMGRKQRVIVRAVVERHVRRADARQLYDDVTPAPSAAESELVRLSRLASPTLRMIRSATPGKRERRALRRLKGLDD